MALSRGVSYLGPFCRRHIDDQGGENNQIFVLVKAVLESLLPQDENTLEPILKVHSRDHVELEFILVKSLKEPGIDDVPERLLIFDPSLQDDIAGFKKLIVQE